IGQFQQHFVSPDEFAVQDDAPFQARLEAVPLDDSALWSLRGSIIGANRSKAAVAADGNDHCCLIFNSGKPFRVVQPGRAALAPPGPAILITEGAPGRFDVDCRAPGEEQVTTMSLRLPRSLLAGAVGVPEDHVVCPIGGESEPLRLYRSYAETLMATGGV